MKLTLTPVDLGALGGAAFAAVNLYCLHPAALGTVLGLAAAAFFGWKAYTTPRDGEP